MPPLIKIILSTLSAFAQSQCDFSKIGPPYFLGRQNGVDADLECEMHYVEANDWGGLASGTCCQSSDCSNVNFGLMLNFNYNAHLKEVPNSEDPRILAVAGYGEGFICTQNNLNFYCLQSSGSYFQVVDYDSQNSPTGLFESNFAADMRRRSGNFVAISRSLNVLTVAVTETGSGKQLIYSYNVSTRTLQSLGWLNQSDLGRSHFSGFSFYPTDDKYLHIFGSTHTKQSDDNFGFVLMLDTSKVAGDTNYWLRADYFESDFAGENGVVTSFVMSSLLHSFYSIVYHTLANYQRGVSTVKTEIRALDRSITDNKDFEWAKQISEGTQLTEVSNLLVKEQILNGSGIELEPEYIYAVYRTDNQRGVPEYDGAQFLIRIIASDGTIDLVKLYNFNENGNFNDFRLAHTSIFSQFYIYMVGETKRFEYSGGSQDFTSKKGFINMMTIFQAYNDDLVSIALSPGFFDDEYFDAVDSRYYYDEPAIDITVLTQRISTYHYSESLTANAPEIGLDFLDKNINPFYLTYEAPIFPAEQYVLESGEKSFSYPLPVTFMGATECENAWYNTVWVVDPASFSILDDDSATGFWQETSVQLLKANTLDYSLIADYQISATFELGNSDLPQGYDAHRQTASALFQILEPFQVAEEEIEVFEVEEVEIPDMNIEPEKPNTAPTTVGNNIQDIDAVFLTFQQVVLPSFYDDQDDAFSVTLVYNTPDSESFIFIQENDGENLFTLSLDLTSEGANQVYQKQDYIELEIQLKETETEDLLQSYFTFKVNMVVDEILLEFLRIEEQRATLMTEIGELNDDTFKLRAGQKPLYAEFTSFRNKGSSYITFSQRLDQQSQRSPEFLKALDVIDLEIEGPRAPYNFTWEVIKIHERHIELYIEIEDPELLGMLSDHEHIYVYFEIRQAFKSYQGVILRNKKTTFHLENLSEEELGAAEQLGSAVKGAGITTIVVTILIQIVLQVLLTFRGGSLQLLWGLVNTIQLLAFLPLISFVMPSFLYQFFKNLNAFNFFFIDFEKYILKYLNLEQTLIPFDAQFPALGFETSNIIINGADILVAAFVCVLFYQLMKLLHKRLSKFSRAKQLIDYLLEMIIWGLVIRFMLETYLTVCLAIWLNFYFFSFSTTSESFSSAITIIISLAYSTLFFFAYLILHVKRRKLKQKRYIQKFGAFYEELRLSSKMALLYNLFFMLRRTLFVAIIVHINKHSLVQWLLVNYLSVFVSFLFNLSSKQLIFCATNLLNNKKSREWKQLMK